MPDRDTMMTVLHDIRFLETATPLLGNSHAAKSAAMDQAAAKGRVSVGADADRHSPADDLALLHQAARVIISRHGAFHAVVQKAMPHDGTGVLPVYGHAGQGVRKDLTVLQQQPPGRNIHTIMPFPDRKSTRLNSSHANISYAVFCLKK